MSVLIIIACSGIKVEGGQIVEQDPDHNLVETQNALANRFGITQDGVKMPAYLRYGANQVGNGGGRLYTHMNWELALDLVRTGELKILIASAYYGLIPFDFPIVTYDLKMSQSKRFWLQANTLRNWLTSFLAENPNINSVRGFLSNEYASAVQLEELGIQNDYKAYDRGAGVATNMINPLLLELQRRE